MFKLIFDFFFLGTMARGRRVIILESPPRREESEDRTSFPKQWRKRPRNSCLKIIKNGMKIISIWNSYMGCPEVDVVYHITKAFDLWASIFSLSQYIYPNLVWEFYANVVNKKGHNEEEIQSFIQGMHLMIT